MANLTVQNQDFQSQLNSVSIQLTALQQLIRSTQVSNLNKSQHQGQYQG